MKNLKFVHFQVTTNLHSKFIDFHDFIYRSMDDGSLTIRVKDYGLIWL